MKALAFTVDYGRSVNELKTSCYVGDSAMQRIQPFDLAKAIKVQALWDTGASGSVISRSLAEQLNLAPITQCKTYHAQGESIVNVYLVDLVLPNNLLVRELRVSEGVLNGFDVLVGMDIIGKGDFALSNRDNKTLFSFQIPPTHHYDFVEQINNGVGIKQKKKHK